MADPTHKYLAVLGLSPGSPSEAVKAAFKELAFQYHPDRNPHNEWAEEKFKEVVEAYSFLSGNQEAYQALQSPSAKASVSVDQVQDIYQILFDIELTPATTRPRPLTQELELTVEEAFLGGDFKLVLERFDLCPQCQGSGVEQGAKTFTCTYCFGEGEVESRSDPAGWKECPKCNGRGFLSSKGCVKCRAKGIRVKPVKRILKVPPRTAPGTVLSLAREGHEFKPGERGDVNVVIQVKKDPRFTFDGKDIICETTVDMANAALGGEVTVPTLAGPKKISLSPGTQSGQVLRLKGLGLGGDQFLRIWVQTPQAVSERERNLLRGLKNVRGSHKPGLWTRLKKWIW
jgi:molecular chaperone DnaJ